MRTYTSVGLALAALAIVTGRTSGADYAATHRAVHSKNRKDAGADPAAYALLKGAHDKREAFPATFTGFRANVDVNDNGKELKGMLTYDLSADMQLILPNASKEQMEWTNDQLATALSHRRRAEFSQSDGSYPLSFMPDDHSPLGRAIALNDGMKSYYRVKDGQITEVTRSAGPIRFTITVLANKIVDSGKYLPAEFVVTYFDPSGAIKRVDEFSDGFAKVGGAWIPSTRRVVTAENGGFVTRTIALSNVHLLPPPPVK